MSCECDHSYQFQNVVYQSGHTLPGSGARVRTYYDKYYCIRCLEVEYKNPRDVGNDYGKPLEGTFPK